MLPTQYHPSRTCRCSPAPRRLLFMGPRREGHPCRPFPWPRILTSLPSHTPCCKSCSCLCFDLKFMKPYVVQTLHLASCPQQHKEQAWCSCSWNVLRSEAVVSSASVLLLLDFPPPHHLLACHTYSPFHFFLMFTYFRKRVSTRTRVGRVREKGTDDPALC